MSLSALTTAPGGRILGLCLLLSLGFLFTEASWAEARTGGPDRGAPREADRGSVSAEAPDLPPADAQHDGSDTCLCASACPCVATLTLPASALRVTPAATPPATPQSPDAARPGETPEPPVPPPVR